MSVALSDMFDKTAERNVLLPVVCEDSMTQVLQAMCLTRGREGGVQLDVSTIKDAELFDGQSRTVGTVISAFKGIQNATLIHFRLDASTESGKFMLTQFGKWDKWCAGVVWDVKTGESRKVSLLQSRDDKHKVTVVPGWWCSKKLPLWSSRLPIAGPTTPSYTEEDLHTPPAGGKAVVCSPIEERHRESRIGPSRVIGAAAAGGSASAVD